MNDFRKHRLLEINVEMDKTEAWLFFFYEIDLTSLLFTNKKLYCIQACMKFLYPASKLLPKTQSESFTASLVLKSELATFEALQA